MSTTDHISKSQRPHTSGSSPSSSDNDTVVAHKEHSSARQDFGEHTNTLNPVDTYKTYEEHGVLIDGSQGKEQAKLDYEHHKHLWWYRVRYVCRDPFAEFCGTMIMLIFGSASVAQVSLSANPNLPPASQDKGAYQSISWGWGIGVSLLHCDFTRGRMLTHPGHVWHICCRLRRRSLVSLPIFTLITRLTMNFRNPAITFVNCLYRGFPW